MDEPAGPGGVLSRVLDAAEAASPLEAVEGVTGALAASLGAGASFFLIADMSGRGLVRLSHVAPGGAVESGVRFDDEERGTVLPFDGGPAEEAMRTQTVQVVPPVGRGGRWGVLAPVTERGEALGLLQMSLPTEPDRGVLTQIAHAAHVLSFVVIANRRHTDLYEWGQRTTRFRLPAEIQRRLLPAAFTCEAGAFTLSAWLEPASSIGGDTFDYCLGRNGLYLSVTDAMGHGVASALTATLCVGSLRNSRRAGSSLLEQAADANLALFEHASASGAESFSTGLLGRLDLRTGCLSLVNAGHIAPFLWRDGRVSEVPVPPDVPLGLFGDSVYRSTEVSLEPGDRLVLVTDGMLERDAAGVDLAAEIARSRALHPRETTRRLADMVVEACGPELADDATLLILDWHGGHGGARVAVAGAEPSYATAARVVRG
jgi:serine phosphatase RsbU (regulator of sigma subunit)